MMEIRRLPDWNPDELHHHGIKDQRWGIRRYQNPDGTLTAAGKERLDKFKARESVPYNKLNKQLEIKK